MNKKDCDNVFVYINRYKWQTSKLIDTQTLLIDNLQLNKLNYIYSVNNTCRLETVARVI